LQYRHRRPPAVHERKSRVRCVSCRALAIT
jgi:hypothetical protein